ncbi:hypothetical protein [Candidatus Burkholderia verschuerenii]|uniref:hypothetical protein n=1 Tax=Candidatus Burkholderia verschuerenii TaxID=242163 RepID=UPI00067A96DC|nr:hypothetical protein [Candidatus Burkholderia verschuerenii]
MKISHLATVALLAASAISSIGALGLTAHQFTLQRSAVSVMANTTVVERLQGMNDALGYVPEGKRRALISTYGFSSEREVQVALTIMRRELVTSQQVRAEELSTNDKRLTALILACGLSAIVAMMAAIALFDIGWQKHQRTLDRAAHPAARPNADSATHPTTA